MQPRDSISMQTVLRPRPRFPLEPARSLAKIEYQSILARIHHTLLPIITYAHVPVTIFLDYNAVFILIQIASGPETSADGVGAVSGTGAAWWFALGVYAVADVAWLLGVVVLYEGFLQFGRTWTFRQPVILSIYTSPAAFNLTACRSYALYSFLYRVRLSASSSQFFTETLWFFSQNWPTIITLLPRAIICAAILLIYHPDDTSFSTPPSPRDQVYFEPESQLLSTYAYVVLLINVGWASWRVLLFASSAILLWIKTGLKGLLRRGDYRNSSSPDAESAVALRARSRSRQSEPTLVAGDSSGAQNTDEPGYSPHPGASRARTPGDRSSQTGTPFRPSQEDRILDMPMSSYTRFPDDFAVFDRPLHGWRAQVEERIWNVLENATVHQSERSSQDGTGDSAEAQEAHALSPLQGSRAKRNKDVDWAAMESGEPSAYPQSQTTRTTHRHDSDVSSQSGLAAMDLRRGLCSPTRPFSRPTGKEMTERTVSDSSQAPIIRGRTVSANGILGAPALDVEGRTDKSPKLSPNTSGGDRGTFGRMRHTSLTFAGDIPASLQEIPAYRDRALLGVPGDSRSETTASDSPPLVQRPSPALEPAFHEHSSGALARHVSLMGSTHGLSTGESSRNTSGSGSGPGHELTMGSLGRSAPRLLHPQSAGSLRPNAASATSFAEAEAELGAGPESSSDSCDSHTSTIMSEDSEERRIWASFPEQSRRHPPGLIALKNEQKEIELAEAAIAAEASRQRLAAARASPSSRGEDGDRTPRECVSADTLQGQPGYLGIASPGSSRDRERDLGMDSAGMMGSSSSSGLGGVGGGDRVSGHERVVGLIGLDSLMSISAADRGLIPIKEESWTGSSIDSLSHTHSLSHSHSLSQGSVGGHSSIARRQSSLQARSERKASADSEEVEADQEQDPHLAALARKGATI
ncbi:unnamed protein product [Tilletia controversa]|nr:unnamed protein product [Tilletia controversa]CAD6983785.1 unnamed protein product [Tilletia controversa]